MTDVRAQLADALREAAVDRTSAVIDRQVAAVLSLPNIAIVALPEPTNLPPAQWWHTPIGNVVIDGMGRLIYREGVRSPDDVRALAAALLAAANTAEQTAK